MSLKPGSLCHPSRGLPVTRRRKGPYSVRGLGAEDTLSKGQPGEHSQPSQLGLRAQPAQSPERQCFV